MHNYLQAADSAQRLVFADQKMEIAAIKISMGKAHAGMRQTGWLLAPAAVEPEGDGVLALAAAEIKDEIRELLGRES